MTNVANIVAAIRSVVGSGQHSLHEPSFEGREVEYLNRCISSTMVSYVGSYVDRFESELSNFVGCFLTGTAAEVTPVSCIADNQFKVCETIIDLNESYQALVRKKKAA